MATRPSNTSQITNFPIDASLEFVGEWLADRENGSGPEPLGFPLGLWMLESKFDAMSLSLMDELTLVENARYRGTMWSAMPYGFFVETDGNFVLFDGFRRPLLRKFANGSFRIVATDTPVRFVSEHAIYGDLDASNGIRSAIHSLLMVDLYGLREEIVRRNEICRTVGLPEERLFDCSPPDAPAVKVGYEARSPRRNAGALANVGT
jgi:hypothetical protein